jgi:hypothetical protein
MYFKNCRVGRCRQLNTGSEKVRHDYDYWKDGGVLTEKRKERSC